MPSTARVDTTDRVLVEAVGRHGDQHPQCNTCKRALKRDWKRRNPERVALSKRRARLKRKYGLSVEEHAQLIAEGDACAVCTDSLAGSNKIVRRVGKRVVVACARCGSGLGTFRDDAGLLSAAAALLEST